MAKTSNPEAYLAAGASGSSLAAYQGCRRASQDSLPSRRCCREVACDPTWMLAIQRCATNWAGSSTSGSNTTIAVDVLPIVRFGAYPATLTPGTVAHLSFAGS